MNTALRIALVIGVLIYLVFITVMLKKKSLNLKYALLWIFSAFVMLILAIFPKIVDYIAYILGIQNAVNSIFLIFVFFILLILISLTSIVSTPHRKIKTLIQHMAILEKKIDDIASKM